MKFGRSKQVEQGAQVGVCITSEGISVACADSTTQTAGLPRLKLCQFISAPKKDHSRVLANLVKTHKLEGLPTVCVLSILEYDLFLIEEPEVTAEELLAAVRWKVKDYVEYPIGEAAIDYMPLPTKALDVKGKMGYAVVAKQAIIDEMVQLVNSVGLRVIAVDISETAVCAVMHHIKEMKDGVLCFRLLPGLSQIMILKGGVILLTRNLDLNQAYLLDQTATSGKTPEEKEKLVNDMALEIQRSIEYAVTNLKQGNIKQVIFTPMNSTLEPLIDELKEGLGMSMRSIQLSETVSGVPKMSLIEQGQCLIALGGALR
jgi:MSHA biogenesis protein MshI